MKKITMVAGATLALAFAVSVAVPQAKAYEVNIVAGQDLTVGSSGQNVVVLQGLLSEMGYLNVPSGISLGYFGPLTASALGRYQTAEGVYPPAGYFGALSKIAMRTQFAQHGWLGMLGW